MSSSSKSEDNDSRLWERTGLDRTTLDDTRSGAQRAINRAAGMIVSGVAGRQMIQRIRGVIRASSV